MPSQKLILCLVCFLCVSASKDREYDSCHHSRSVLRVNEMGFRKEHRAIGGALFVSVSSFLIYSVQQVQVTPPLHPFTSISLPCWFWIRLAPSELAYVFPV